MARRKLPICVARAIRFLKAAFNITSALLFRGVPPSLFLLHPPFVIYLYKYLYIKEERIVTNLRKNSCVSAWRAVRGARVRDARCAVHSAWCSVCGAQCAVCGARCGLQSYPSVGFASGLKGPANTGE